MRTRFGTGLAIAMSVLATPLPGQEPHDSASVQTIERLFVVSLTEQSYSTGLASGFALQLSANPALQSYADVTRTFVERYAGFQVVRSDLLQTYRATLTETEARALIALYESESGRNLPSKLMLLNERWAQVVLARLRPHFEELTEAILAQARQTPSSRP